MGNNKLLELRLTIVNSQRGFLQGTCVTVYPLLGKNLLFTLTTASGYANLLSYS